VLSSEMRVAHEGLEARWGEGRSQIGQSLGHASGRGVLEDGRSRREDRLHGDSSTIRNGQRALKVGDPGLQLPKRQLRAPDQTAPRRSMRADSGGVGLFKP
jgi:hypothetical protein